MGMVVKVVIAFCIGAALFSGAQRYWMNAMIERANDPAQRVQLPEPTVAIPTIDPGKMQQTLYPGANRSLSGGFPSR